MRLRMKLASKILLLVLILSFMPTGVTIGYAAETIGYDFVAHAADTGASGVIWSSGAGALTFPGTEGNASGFALKFDKPIFEDGKDYGAGLLFVPNNAANGFIQAIYPPFLVQTGDSFQSRIGCQTGATTCYVAYRLQYQIDGSTDVKTLWKEPPFREKYEGNTYPVNISLNSLAGKNVKFILYVSAYDSSAAGDRALWGSPRITRSGSGVPPTPSTSCTDSAKFESDLLIKDGATFKPGETFTKHWQLRNIGTTTWTTAYQLVFDSTKSDSNQMGGPNTAALPLSVAPNAVVDISVNLTAPSTAGAYTGYWKFKNDKSVDFALAPFGNKTLGCNKSFWVKINVSGTPTPLTLTTTASPAVYDTVDQVITYSYVIKNTGTTTLGPTQFTVTDNLFGAAFNCGAASTSLTPNAEVSCNAAPYKITAANLTAASVTNTATASGGGVGSSAAKSFTINKAVKALTLATSATPTTYSAAGNIITFSYIITNTGNVALGPAQFTVTDGLIGATPINCGIATLTLAPSATVSCTAPYTITAGDMTAVSVTNLATASGGGVGPTPSKSTTITKQ